VVVSGPHGALRSLANAEALSHLFLVSSQEVNLRLVNRPLPLITNCLHCSQVVQSSMGDEGDGDQDRGPSQSSNTVHSDGRRMPSLLLDVFVLLHRAFAESEPWVHHLLGRRRSIRVWEGMAIDSPR